MSIELDVRSTALVLIDLQKGIVRRPNLEPHPGAAVVDRSVALCKAFQAASSPIVLVHVGFSANGADRLAQPVDAPTPVPPGGMPAEFIEFVPEIAAIPADVKILKRQWGAFHGTELDLQLRRRNISTIVLAGIATNFGVESTAREAWQHNYAVVIAEDACTSTGGDMHRLAMEKIFPRIARIRSTEQIVAAMKTG